jgi:hypothetical protein
MGSGSHRPRRFNSLLRHGRCCGGSGEKILDPRRVLSLISYAFILPQAFATCQAEQRTFSLFRRDGTSLPVTVRLGAPFIGNKPKPPAQPEYRCAIQILGIDDERVTAPWGEDPFVALQFAIDLVGTSWTISCGARICKSDFVPTKVKENGFGGIRLPKAVALKDGCERSVRGRANVA